MRLLHIYGTVESRLSECLLSGASNIIGPVFFVFFFEHVFEQCNVLQLFRVRPKVTGKPKVRNIWGISYLEGEKDFNDNHRGGDYRLFVQSISGFQECDEDVETWRACDAEDCGFQMLNDDEIVTSVQEESDPLDDETDEDEDNNNESSTVHQMLTRFLR
ncbi:UNVERIFIED_CONTAM: hypothetical protein NCL1_28656 [Trichonephila clavipes]